MTWRSIESDPPKIGDLVFVGNHTQKIHLPFTWGGFCDQGWTHWSPCNPPADLPPAPKSAFDEWSSASPSCVGCQVSGSNDCRVGIKVSEIKTCWVESDAARILFNAGMFEAGKAKG